MRRESLLVLLLFGFSLGCGSDPTTSEKSGTKKKPRPEDPILVAIEDTGAGAILDKKDRETPIYLVDLTRASVRDNVLEGLAKADLDAPLRLVARNNKRLSDAGFEHLGDIENVKELELNNTKISDDDLVHISKWKDLEVLILSDTGITDAGIVHLKQLPLKKIDLSRTQITNAGVRTLLSIKGLKSIHLANTQIDNVSLHLLRHYRGLKELDITATQIEPFGEERLFRFFPGVRVLH